MVRSALNGGAGPLNEQILEVRYKPNPKVLDYRGSWARALSEALNLPKWTLVENRLDVFTEDESLRVFVSFRNFGLTARDVPTPNFFPDQAQKFIKQLLELTGFDHPVHVQRYGVRLRVATPCSESFKELRSKVAQRYVNITPEASAAIGRTARLQDIGASLNYKDEIGNFNTACGPMEESQLANYFKDRERLPEVALYYDVDYWTKPNATVKDTDVIRLVRTCTVAAWERYERVRNLILD